MPNNQVIKTITGQYICPRCLVVLRGLGGGSHRENKIHYYSASAICDLCGFYIGYKKNVTTGDTEHTVWHSGQVRTHIVNAMTNELLACRIDKGYLYETTKSNGVVGKWCPKCLKYRDSPKNQIWRAPPAKVPAEAIAT